MTRQPSTRMEAGRRSPHSKEGTAAKLSAHQRAHPVWSDKEQSRPGLLAGTECI